METQIRKIHFYFDLHFSPTPCFPIMCTNHALRIESKNSKPAIATRATKGISPGHWTTSRECQIVTTWGIVSSIAYKKKKKKKLPGPKSQQC